MDEINYEPGRFYIFDRGYIDFDRLYVIHQPKSRFVIRAKSNFKFRRQYSSSVNKDAGVKCDQTGILMRPYSSQEYPERIRRIKFQDSEQERPLIFPTNNLDLKAEEIAELYRQCWKIELFLRGLNNLSELKPLGNYRKCY